MGQTSRHDGAIRILDAAGNRASEGLRVMEDLARFALDVEPLTAEIKSIRHELQATMALLGIDRIDRLGSRDTPGDVGTTLEGAGERQRGGFGEVAAAAGGRLTESLRSLEEVAKTRHPASARALESLRYRAYEADRRLGLALHRAAAPQWRLCVLITESLCALPWTDVVRHAIDGGADCLQLREKSLEAGALLERAHELVELAHAGGAAVVINDRPDIALAANADGVHLGQTDLPVAAARRVVGERLRIGVSTSRLDEARAAIDAGVDSLGLGPMFVSSTKPKASLAGVEYLRSVLADDRIARVPHLAISGITAKNIGELAKAGCRGVAVSSVVCAAEDPAAVCRSLLAGLDAR